MGGAAGRRMTFGATVYDAERGVSDVPLDQVVLRPTKS